MSETERRAPGAASQRSREELEARICERTQQVEHMAMIVAASTDAIISSDIEGRIVSWNKAAETIFGYPAEEVIGKTTFLITPPGLIEEAAALKQRVRAGERIPQFETLRLARSGELIEVSMTVFPLSDSAGKRIGTSAIVRDIRESKKTKRRLQQLSWRLLRLQDEERRRLARELHDSTAQSMAALSINLSVLGQSGEEMAEDRRKSLLSDSLLLADSVSRELRTHSYLLHPPLLDERGLRSALSWFVQGFAARSGIRVHLEIADEFGRLPAAVELTIFRIVQECLSNVHRHSRSPEASIRLGPEGQGIVLEIRDIGCGITDDDAEPIGVGIAGMKERLAQLDGSLQIEPNHPGTAVIARIPTVE